MTPAEFWDGDIELTVMYRQAEEYRRKEQNREMWIAGAYIYDILCRVSPLYRFTTERRIKPEPYIPEPYAIDAAESEQRKKRQMTAKQERMKAEFGAFVARLQAKPPEAQRADKGGDLNGNNN